VTCGLLVVGITTGAGEVHPRSTGSRRYDGRRSRGTFSSTVDRAYPYYGSARSDNVSRSRTDRYWKARTYSHGLWYAVASESLTTAEERRATLLRLSS
jgi:hypothetical protein